MVTRCLLFAAALLLSLSFNKSLYAQSYTAATADSSAKLTNTYISTKPAELTGLQLKDVALQQDLQLKLTRPSEQSKLMGSLKQPAGADTRKLYYNMANAFASLRLYPQALKSFFRSRLTDSANVGYLSFTGKDDSVLTTQTTRLAVKRPHSAQITYQHIRDTFNDGKKAAAYAMLVHIKQPIPGKNKVHKLADSGHSFITLIKYNSDTTYTSISFGFYPKHHHPFAGTPLFPYSHSAFKDDDNYKCDETVGKFISQKTFEDILTVAKQYDGIRYHLSRKNCTDFVLDAAATAGIKVTETVGSWPLGKGNNPGVTGQSILLGKITDNDPAGLFIDYEAKLSAKP